MTASDNLGQQFFHSSRAGHLEPGDYIHPAAHPEGMTGIFSGSFKELTHPEFVHMTRGTENITPAHALYGPHHYEVEPTGLTNPYDWSKTPHPQHEQAHPGHWVSLAPVRVKRRVPAAEMERHIWGPEGPPQPPD